MEKRGSGGGKYAKWSGKERNATSPIRREQVITKQKPTKKGTVVQEGKKWSKKMR